ncbi:TetR/AcrR family transcriptional regulator [Paenibacillus antri]|uniref:TetR/AcrR family transcriptional regulator n=1 Tax=Paenibacillus antri TaxID=2582848 RepID=A0A5R9G9A6_9BACL|nr:TetR/AcrR family transcriptional regulator [Paenibacillus antri]TLS49323.1 TetR/AcrR family transcriptional regulator [Paenibacillus antri]
MSEPPVQDRRIVRTKRLIRDALTELIEEKGFEGITVKDLTDRADINRGTFYIHFKDKYDLLDQSEKEIMDHIERLAASGYQWAMAGDWKEIIHGATIPFVQKLFEYFQEHARFMNAVLGPKGDPSFQKRLREVIRKRVLPVLTQTRHEVLVPVHYLTAYVSSAHLGVIQEWLENGMETPPPEMATILARLSLLGPGHVAGITRE